MRYVEERKSQERFHGCPQLRVLQVLLGLERLLEAYGGWSDAAWAAEVRIVRTGSHSNNTISFGQLSIQEVVLILFWALKHISMLMRTAREETGSETIR